MSATELLKKQSYVRCLVFLVLLCLIFACLSPHFWSLSNFDNVLSASSVVGLLAIGATFIIASGEIDLSIASVMALAGTVTAFVIQDSTLGPILSLVVACTTAIFCGAITAMLINITQAPSFIVTLGMLSVARALAYIVADGTPIYGLPEPVTVLGQGEFWGISVPVFLLLLAVVIANFVMQRTVFGSRVLGFGDSPFAARAMGIDVNKLRLINYSFAGLFTGLAGFVFMARTNCGDPTAGQNYELMAITAVILGGAKLFGGSASVVGTILGVACLGVLQNGLNLLAVSSYYQVLFVGLVLISAAFLDRGATAE